MHTTYFTETIQNWQDWAAVFQSISAFEPLIRAILQKEKLPLGKVTQLTPGTNAVFRVEQLVIKIYAPKESGMDQTSDQKTELFAARYAKEKGVRAPQVVAHGSLSDRYDFAYMLMPYMEGQDLESVLRSSSKAQQEALGRALREATDRLNQPIPAFNTIDVLKDPERESRWRPYTAAFRTARRAYLESLPASERVFTHGDLCADNVLVTPQGLCLLDFADAVLAPRCYEGALIAFEYRLYPRFLRGYFAQDPASELTERLLQGILMHDFGGDIVKSVMPTALQMETIEPLRRAIQTILGGKA